MKRKMLLVTKKPITKNSRPCIC